MISSLKSKRCRKAHLTRDLASPPQQQPSRVKARGRVSAAGFSSRSISRRWAPLSRTKFSRTARINLLCSLNCLTYLRCRSSLQSKICRLSIQLVIHWFASSAQPTDPRSRTRSRAPEQKNSKTSLKWGQTKNELSRRALRKNEQLKLWRREWENRRQLSREGNF